MKQDDAKEKAGRIANETQFPRRRFLKSGVIGTAAVLGPSAVIGEVNAAKLPSETHGRGSETLDRAIAAYDALQRYFYRPKSKLYYESYPHNSDGYSYAWPFSQAFEATLGVYGMQNGRFGSRSGIANRDYVDDVRDRLDGLSAYLESDKGSEHVRLVR